MNDSNEKLETELAAMRPRPLSPGLIDGIESALTEASRPWGDRLLIFTMGMGSIAACVIVGLLTFSGPRASDFRPTHSRQPIATAPMLGSYSLAAVQNGDAGLKAIP